MSKRVLFVSSELIGSALCQKFLAEGADVKLFIKNKDWKRCLDGIVPKTDNWRNELNWVGKDGLIVFDDVIFGEEQDWLRHFGYNVVGSSLRADTLETDRKHFQDISKKFGLQTLESHDFLTAEEAIRFIQHNQRRWVVKQSSHLSSLNYIGRIDSAEDVIDIIKLYKKKHITPIHIQEFVTGVEVGVARYFNGHDWVGPVEINHEYKRLFNDDSGPLTPEMGTILWFTDTEVKLFKETLAKLKPYLQMVNFRGDIDINCIVNEEGVWPLEATPRFGTPSTEIHTELVKSSWTDFLMSVAKGENYNLNYSTNYGIDVSIAVPPFPHEQDILDWLRSKFERKAIYFDTSLTKDDLEHMHFEEVSMDKDGYFFSGTHGWVLHVTSQGETIGEARQKAYDIVNKITLSNMFYRNDIGVRVAKYDIPTLKQWGWI